MAIATAAWGEADSAESFLRAEMEAALGYAAQVESVVIDHLTGIVDVTVRLPEDLTDSEQACRRDLVQSQLEVVVAEAPTDEALVLAPVRYSPSRKRHQERT
jgi:hypothetical protein